MILQQTPHFINYIFSVKYLTQSRYHEEKEANCKQTKCRPKTYHDSLPCLFRCLLGLFIKPADQKCVDLNCIHKTYQSKGLATKQCYEDGESKMVLDGFSVPINTLALGQGLAAESAFCSLRRVHFFTIWTFHLFLNAKKQLKNLSP